MALEVRMTVVRDGKQVQCVSCDQIMGPGVTVLKVTSAQRRAFWCVSCAQALETVAMPRRAEIFAAALGLTGQASASPTKPADPKNPNDLEQIIALEVAPLLPPAEPREPDLAYLAAVRARGTWTPDITSQILG